MNLIVSIWVVAISIMIVILYKRYYNQTVGYSSSRRKPKKLYIGIKGKSGINTHRKITSKVNKIIDDTDYMCNLIDEDIKNRINDIMNGETRNVWGSTTKTKGLKDYDGRKCDEISKDDVKKNIISILKLHNRHKENIEDIIDIIIDDHCEKVGRKDGKFESSVIQRSITQYIQTICPDFEYNEIDISEIIGEVVQVVQPLIKQKLECASDHYCADHDNSGRPWCYTNDTNETHGKRLKVYDKGGWSKIENRVWMWCDYVSLGKGISGE